MNEAQSVSGINIERRRRLQIWLRIDESTKATVYEQVFSAARISSVNYWLEIVFSAAIATFGLVLNSPAVIIGAMLISPLMGPIMATGMALAVGDLYLAAKAVANILLSVLVAVALSALIVWLLPFHSATTEVLARSNPNLLDLGVAIFSGLAGSIVVCRGGGGGGVTALPGVAIAVALMPPLCTMGFGLGSGLHSGILGGAGLLFLTNIVAIVSSAFIVFLLIGMSSPQVRSAMVRAHAGEQLAQRLSHGPLAKVFGQGGQLRWRILILAILLGAVAFPLRRALLHVASETRARNAVQVNIAKLAPSGAVVSQAVQIGNDSILIRIISTREISPEAIRETEQAIAKRTGRHVQLSVQEVASRTELADLAARLSTPGPAPEPPQPQSLDRIRAGVLAQIQPVVQNAWPPEAPLQTMDLDLASGGIVLNVTYRAQAPLDDIPLGLITRDLREKLKDPGLVLHATAILPPRPPRRRRR